MSHVATRVRLAHPERVLDAGLVGGGPGGSPRHRVVQERGEFARTRNTAWMLDRFVRTARINRRRSSIGPGIVCSCGTIEPPVLELHGADHAPDRAAPAVQREPHLVRVERRALGRDERTARAMSRARTPPAYTCRPSRPHRRRPSEDEADHVVWARVQVVPPLIVGDDVVGRGRDQVVRADDRAVEQQADEGRDEGHAPCIAAPQGDPPAEGAYELFSRGMGFLRDGHPHQAAMLLGRAKLIEPDKASIREALGRALHVRPDRSARREFAKVVQIEPASDYAHFALALA